MTLHARRPSCSLWEIMIEPLILIKLECRCNTSKCYWSILSECIKVLFGLERNNCRLLQRKLKERQCRIDVILNQMHGKRFVTLYIWKKNDLTLSHINWSLTGLLHYYHVIFHSNIHVVVFFILHSLKNLAWNKHSGVQIWLLYYVTW